VSARRPPMLLFDAGYYGTLAAARSLGRAGIPVVVADPSRVASTRFSRYVTRAHVCPPVTRVESFVEWLLDLAAREGEHVVYPTSDEVAYVLATHKDRLSDRLRLYQPALSTITRVLDKKSLLEAARSVGFEVPETWSPESPADFERAAREADGPLMIKPRTQLFMRTHSKGIVATGDAASLRAQHDRFIRENPYGPPVTSRSPDLARPLLQRYYVEALQAIESVTGFRDADGRISPLLGSVKVLQRPRRMGVGLCFERATVSPEVAARTSRLLEALAYFGVFELEFVRVGERQLLIDMNPRFYNQLAFDVARGLPLPLLAYWAAMGDQDEVRRLLSDVRVAETPRAFCNSLGVRLLVGAQRLAGTMPATEAARWSQWMRSRRGALVDAVRDPDDPMPFWAETGRQLYDCARHPRFFVGMIALDR
jgi:D-aspartate ligase